MSVLPLLRTPSPLIDPSEATSPSTSPLDEKMIAIYNLQKLTRTGRMEASFAKRPEMTIIIDAVDGFNHLEGSPFQPAILLFHERLRSKPVGEAYERSTATDGQFSFIKKEEYLAYLTAHPRFADLISHIAIDEVYEQASRMRSFDATTLTAILHRMISTKDKALLENLSLITGIFLEASVKKG